MKIKKLLILPILIISLFTACGDKENNDNSSNKEIKYPTFNLKSTTGENVTIQITKDKWIFKEHPNKVVLINFFATWCPPCKAEIPHLNNLMNKYKDDFVTIAILLEEGKSNAEVNEFIESFDVQYQITNSKENFELADAFGGIKGIPTLFMFDKNGQQVEKYKGAVHEEILDSDIKKAIKSSLVKKVIIDVNASKPEPIQVEVK